MLYKRNLVGLFCFLSAIVFFRSPLQAQVTIGSLETPSVNALLDLKETNTGDATKGLLLPRVELSSTSSASPMTSHEAGLCVYNKATANDVTPGFYFNDGSKWVRMSTFPNFFYMPSILLPLDTADPAYSGGTFTIDLYAQYAAQYNLTSSATSTKNPGATASLPVYASTALDYFITYYDDEVFSNVAVSNSGVLTYQLAASPVVSEKTFMNIVFQVKQ